MDGRILQHTSSSLAKKKKNISESDQTFTYNHQLTENRRQSYMLNNTMEKQSAKSTINELSTNGKRQEKEKDGIELYNLKGI